MADEPRIGEFNPDGSIKQDVRVSVLSGKRTEPGDPMIGIQGTPYFYRLEGQEFRLLHDDGDPERAASQRASVELAINEAMPTQPFKADVVAPATPITTEPKRTPKDDKGVANG